MQEVVEILEIADTARLMISWSLFHLSELSVEQQPYFFQSI